MFDSCSHCTITDGTERSLLSDKLLGLAALIDAAHQPGKVEDVAMWQAARSTRDYSAADHLLAGLRADGVHPLNQPVLLLHPAPWAPSRGWPAPLSAASDVLSTLGEPDACDVSVSLLAHRYPDDVRRCLDAPLRHAGGYHIEVIVVDNDADDPTRAVLRDFTDRDARIRVMQADHRLGEAEGRNVALRGAHGRVVLLLDTGVEVTGDIVGPLLTALADPTVGVVGRALPFLPQPRHLHQFPVQAPRVARHPHPRPAGRHARAPRLAGALTGRA
jgi:hypothetical protein